MLVVTKFMGAPIFDQLFVFRRLPKAARGGERISYESVAADSPVEELPVVFSASVRAVGFLLSPRSDRSGRFTLTESRRDWSSRP